MHKLIFLIGASGSGKTATARILESKKLLHLRICYFDSIGIPSNQEMIKEYGSLDGWQKAKTTEWVKTIKVNYLQMVDVILDGQTRPLFIEESCDAAKIKLYEIILFDCSDKIRNQRLIARGHVEIANETMINWANYLRRECISRGCKVIDTSDLTIEQSVSRLILAIGDFK